MTARRQNLADRALCQTMRDRVGASLRGMRERGAIASDDGKGAGVRWGLAPLWSSHTSREREVRL